jgi:nicotinate-nucleotide adenylyltransferase
LQAIGIFGGTFDPIHFGHLRMAEELAEALGLAEVRFLPAARPPHRGEPHGTAEHRIEMTRLAIAGNPRFSLDLREFERTGPSYMVDTLASLRSELGETTPLYLMLGADAFLGIQTWHRWQTLFELAHIAVAHRPGFSLDAGNAKMPPALRVEWLSRYREAPTNTAAGQILLREITALDISASNIRKTLRHGGSVRYLLPEASYNYIHTQHLYEKAPHGT